MSGMIVMKALIALLFLLVGVFVYTSMNVISDAGPKKFILDSEAEKMLKSSKLTLFIKNTAASRKEQSTIKFITIAK